MATISSAQSVKSLNKTPGGNRFVFKTFSQRLEEVEIDVFRSLDHLNSKPSDGSSFFCNCLIQWRELNTAKEFMSLFVDLMPKARSLPLVLIHKDYIISEILSRLTMEARLSLEPILKLIAALSRDLLDDFFPYLQKVVDSLVDLLRSGADRDPEIIEQIFTSLSYVIMHLQKYLIRDVVHILKITTKLRHYPESYIQDFMAEALSLLLRNAPSHQVVTGIKKIAIEVAKKPFINEMFAASSLLTYAMKGTSMCFHSRADQVFRLLINQSTYSMVDKYSKGAETFLDVVIATVQNLFRDFQPQEMKLIWDCLEGEITECVNNIDVSVHLIHIVTLLCSIMELYKRKKNNDNQQILKLLSLLVDKYILDFTFSEEKKFSQVVERVQQLMLIVISVLSDCNDLPFLFDIASKWTPVFKLKNKRLVEFIRELLVKDVRVIELFRGDILSALDNLVQVSHEDVVYLTLVFCEKIQISNAKMPYLEAASLELLNSWIQYVNSFGESDNSSSEFNEVKLSLLWGTLSCSAYSLGIESKELLVGLVISLDRILSSKNGDNFSKVPMPICQGLLGAALQAYHKLSGEVAIFSEPVYSLLHIAIKNKLSVPVLLAIAEILESDDKSTFLGCPDEETLTASLITLTDPLVDNMCHSDKEIRVLTLRILRCLARRAVHGVSENLLIDGHNCNVFDLLYMIEETEISISSSRRITLLISKVDDIIASGSMPEALVSFIFNGVVGILHNRFSYMWEPAVKCLISFINNYSAIVWEKIIGLIGVYQLKLPEAQDIDAGEPCLLNISNDLVSRFNESIYRKQNSNPSGSILSLFLRALQKLPTVFDSRSKELVILFLKFMGYDADNCVSVGGFNTLCCKGKEWKGVLREWLNLLKLARNLRSVSHSQFLKDVLISRFLDSSNAETQMTVLECLLIWKDEFLLPYEHHLRSLINSKNLREELAKWSLSADSNLIENRHRPHLLLLIIQILIPKVRQPRTLASTKHRKAVISFIAQLCVKELSFFFVSLMKPFCSLATHNVIDKFLKSPEKMDGFNPMILLDYFTFDDSSSLRKSSGFLHVIEEIMENFDQLHIGPFLDLLMGCTVHILGSCTLCVEKLRNQDNPSADVDFVEHENDSLLPDLVMKGAGVKKMKDLRSLCLKVTSFALTNIDCSYISCKFWDAFFTYVKPLIRSFKQGCCSSDRPSYLFTCFIAMSRSKTMAPMLFKEEGLVSDIFSILSMKVDSWDVVLSLFKFIENLLIRYDDPDDEDPVVKTILTRYMHSLICNLNIHFSKNSFKKDLAKLLEVTALNIFRTLSKHVEASHAEKFVEALLLLLSSLRGRNPGMCVEILDIMRETELPRSAIISAKIVRAVCPLLISSGHAVRLSVSILLDRLSESDSSLLTVAGIFSELNSRSAMEIDEVDFDGVLLAYEKISLKLFRSVNPNNMLILIYQFLYDMTSDELMLRQNALNSLMLFVEFGNGFLGEQTNSGEIMEVNCPTTVGWTAAHILRILIHVILKHVGEQMYMGSSIRKEWMELLRGMVLGLPQLVNLHSFKTLCSQDVELDFFINIVHLQKHRRGRAISRFRNAVISGGMSPEMMDNVFVPLFWNIMLDTPDGKGEHLRENCLETLASISGFLSWNLYYKLLIRSFREMKLKPEKQKLLLRLICSILDHCHFPNHGVNEDSGSHSCDGEVDDSDVLQVVNEAPSSNGTHECLKNVFLPKIHKMLSDDKGNVNVNASLAEIKILKLLPGDALELHLRSILHRICNFLKNRLESIRDEARSALASCLKVLGTNYLQLIVTVLKGTLRRGFEVHVLGYTMNFILSKCLNSFVGNLDYCMFDLLEVAENDIFGDVSEEKDVEKIASKMKETKKKKSFETLELITSNITFKTHALKLISSVASHLPKHATPKIKQKFQVSLDHIASGIRRNPSATETDLFVFIYTLIEDCIVKEHKLETGREVMIGAHCSHPVLVFAMDLLSQHLKNIKPGNNRHQLLSMLDPFVKLMANCLNSKHEDVLSVAIKCLTPLIMLHLPSLKSESDKIKVIVLEIAQNSVYSSGYLMQSCLKLLTDVLRNTTATLSHEQLCQVIQFPVFVDIRKHPSLVALSLLKSIVTRKIIVPEIYDMAISIAEVMVTTQVESIRKKCSQIFLQFLLDYPLSEKRLRQHLIFLLVNLRYEHSYGREAVLEMMHTILVKFPQSVIDEQADTFFVYLVFCLANDNDNKVRSLVSVAIKQLFQRFNTRSLLSVIKYTLSWYFGKKCILQGAAAEVIGLLVKIAASEFQKHVPSVLMEMKNILMSAINTVKYRKSGYSDICLIPRWKEAYYSLIMFESLLSNYTELCFSTEVEGIWDAVGELLLHPHTWLRDTSLHLVALYFLKVSDSNQSNKVASLDDLFLMNPARLFILAASFYRLLRRNTMDVGASNLITENLVFSIFSIHHLMQKNSHMEFDRDCLLKGLGLLDPRNCNSMFTDSMSSMYYFVDNEAKTELLEPFLVSILLKKLGRIAILRETAHMKIVFSIFKRLSSKIEPCHCRKYASDMVPVLYKVCEGFSGRTIPDDIKLLAEEAIKCIQEKIGTRDFVEVYNEIRKNLKEKRDKRKHTEKLMAVVDPMRHSKRKIAAAAKHRAYKKRKIMKTKMSRWLRGG